MPPTSLCTCPPALRALDPTEQPYPVTISPRLRALADELDREPH